jgi:hypothetical protein
MSTQIIYNVTVKVEKTIATEWLQWLKQEHVPEVIGTGCFQDARIVQLIETDDSEGPTYAIQYSAASRSDYDRYISEFASEMRKKTFEKWGNQFVAFRSVMKVV